MVRRHETRPGWGAAGDAALTSDPRILVVAPDDDLIGSLCQGLDALGWRTVTARSLAGAVQVLIDWPLETVILDARLADGTSIARDPVIPGGRADIRERSALVGMHLLRMLLGGGEAAL